MHLLFPSASKITAAQRHQAMLQRPLLIWLTGLSGSGKTTLAQQLEQYLFNNGYKVFVLDGDNLRRGLNNDLGFSEADRRENLRRAAETACLMLDAGLLLVGAFISPLAADREAVRQIVGADRFVEVYVNCALETCELRDVKGLYQKARQGLLPNFTGISAPYEAPLHPDVEVKTDCENIEASVEKILTCIAPRVKPAGMLVQKPYHFTAIKNNNELG